MSKKTVLITGASRGIGKAILESLNKEYFIVGTGTSESSVQSILENINSMNIEGNAFKLDLGDRDSIKEYLRKLRHIDEGYDALIKICAWNISYALRKMNGSRQSLNVQTLLDIGNRKC